MRQFFLNAGLFLVYLFVSYYIWPLSQGATPFDPAFWKHRSGEGEPMAFFIMLIAFVLSYALLLWFTPLKSYLRVGIHFLSMMAGCALAFALDFNTMGYAVFLYPFVAAAAVLSALSGLAITFFGKKGSARSMAGKSAAGISLLLLALSFPRDAHAGPERFQSDPLISLNVSRISIVDANLGIYWSHFRTGSAYPGLELSVTPGLTSTSLNLGWAEYQFRDNYAGVDGGFSVNLMAGRTYLFDTMFGKDRFFYGVQGKLELFFINLKLGLLYSERDRFGINVGFGLGH